VFSRARRRLSLLYLGLFALVLGLFSAVFYFTIAAVLAPAFDIAPELTNRQAAEVAYRATVEQIAIALIVADLVVVAFVGAAAWLLAARTLRPIREAHQRQRRFVADASHEMRSPITAIRSTAEAALSGSAGEAELRRALSVVADASERLTRVTGDLLLLARADEGLLEARTETVDLSVLVAEIVEEQQLVRRPDAPAAVVDLAPGVLVRADPEQIGRVTRNLLDNAYRHGGPGVHVRVTTQRTEREAVVEVSDDGPGIAATDLDRVFEPFYRVRADAEAPPGSGLGLAIAMSLARQNGGRLQVESQPAKGARFRLVLPRFR
jgi:signal transduction histidine kinase